MGFVDAQLFPHHDCDLILVFSLSVIHVPPNRLDVQTALPFQDCMTSLIAALADAGRCEPGPRL